MSKRPHLQLDRRFWSTLLLLPALTLHAQYTGKVGQGADKKPTLRATAVYEYTGSMAKPNASRLVPVVVWDGERYQPGGLYLARPEPLAVAPGTQYVLERSGVPAGLFNIGSAGQLNGSWVGLGHFQADMPKPAPKLVASKTPPVLTGGSGKGKADTPAGSTNDASTGPVLHRKTDSKTDPETDPDASSGTGTTGTSSDDRPTLHRRDTDSSTPSTSTPASTPASTSASTSDTTSGKTSSDPDRPTLHRKDTAGTDAAAAPDKAAAPDPDRPTLHRHADASTATTTTPDPDRPHLRYGQGPADEARVLPLELKDTKTTPAAGATGPAIAIGQTVAVSDTEADEPHPFRYAWSSASNPAQAQADAQAAMHALALKTLASAVQASFGPAAKSDAALRKAADTAQASFGPGTPRSSAASRKRPAANAQPASSEDPLLEPQFSAWELSYGGGATYVYSAHTASTGTDRRYVTVIAQPDFYGKPQAVFAQTTRGGTLGQTPALHLVDAVDTDGDHRAELLFEEQTGDAAPGGAGRQFAIYSIIGGQAKQVYASDPGVAQ
jgi:hypothetical protein